MKRKRLHIVLFILGIFLLIFTTFRLYVLGKQQNATSKVLSAIPITEEFTRRQFDPNRKTTPHTAYPQIVKEKLMSPEEQDLTKMRCSEQFVRNWEAIFFLQDTKTTKFSIGMDNDAMLKLVQEADKHIPTERMTGKKFLLGRLCETEKKIRFLEYHTGIQKQVFDDFFTLGTNINSFILPTDQYGIFDKAINLTNRELGPNVFCYPLQITNTDLLYYHCSLLQETSSTTWYYEVDLQIGVSTTLSTCITTYGKTTERVCK